MCSLLMGQSAGKGHIPHSKSDLSSQQDVSSSEDEPDSASPTKRGSQKKRGKDKHKMSLFRRQSEKAKKRSDHQKWLVL